MKLMIVILSLLIILAGILPFFGEEGLAILPEAIPTSGVGYSTIIIIIGAVGVVYALAFKMVMGIEKIVTIAIGLLTILGGILPLINEALQLPLPTSGLVYSILIIIIGIIGLVYGFMSLG